MATGSGIRSDPVTGFAEQANAGPPPTLRRVAGTWHKWKSSVPPIGVLPDTQPQLQSVLLNPGDLVVCFSDGYSEIQTAQGLWGEQGIREAVPRSLLSANEAIQAIQAAAEQVSSGDSIADDHTLLPTAFQLNHAFP